MGLGGNNGIVIAAKIEAGRAVPPQSDVSTGFSVIVAQGTFHHPSLKMGNSALTCCSSLTALNAYLNVKICFKRV